MSCISPRVIVTDCSFECVVNMYDLRGYFVIVVVGMVLGEKVAKMVV